MSSTAVLAYDSIELKQVLTLPSNQPFSPMDLVVDKTGRLWVTDAEHNDVVVFSSSGDVSMQMGQKGSAPGQWNEPHGIGTDSEGLIYVADTGNQRIQVLGSDGKPRAMFGEKGADPGQFHDPSGLTVSQDGAVIVGDRGNNRLELFSRSGIFLQAVLTGSEMEGVGVDAAGRLYLANAKLHQVEQWSSAGQLFHSFSGSEPGIKAFAKPSGLAVSALGLLYVSDRVSNQIRELDLTGHTLGVFGHEGKGEGEFRDMGGIAVSGENVYVADTGNHRVVVFTLSRTTRPAALTPAPTVRVQVALKNLWLPSADVIALNPDGQVLTLNSVSGLLTALDKDGKPGTSLNLKKTVALKRGMAMAADASGNLFIVDDGGNRVIKVNASGTKLLEIGKSSSFFKSGEGELAHPSGVAYTKQGTVLVADTGNSRIQAFNDQGLFLFSAGEKGKEPGQLKMPVAVIADSDRIYTVDASNHKVVVFNGAGRFLHEMGLVGGEALQNPSQVAVDREGNLFVLDAQRGRVVIYDDQGVFIAGFGALGKGKGYFDHPHAFALSEDNRLYMAEQGRIQVLRVVLLPPPPTQLKATSGEGFVELKWEAAKTRLPAKYVVFRSNSRGILQRLKETAETTFTDDTLTPGTTYSYTLVTQSALGANSVPTASVMAMAQPAHNGPRLEIVSVHLGDVFSAHYKYYSHVPLGTVVIRNNGQSPVEKVKVTFAIQGYMDFPSEKDIPQLHYQEQQEVPLLVTFNNKILEVSETTPIQAQVKLTFYQNGQENSVVRDLPIKVYSRNAIRWDRKDQFAAFITPNDPPIIDFTRSAVLSYENAHQSVPVLDAMKTAWALFDSLGTYGMTYVPRPTNPYDQISLDSSTVDSMQFARETLNRKSGDCSDGVALLASMLESMSVPTCALDAPGHLFLMLDTGETDSDALGFPADQFVFYAGTYWVPVETTMLGSPFLEAWRKGAEEYRHWADQGKVTPIDIHMAWQTYEPATLPDTSGTAKAPSKEQIDEKFAKDWKALVDLRWQIGREQIQQEMAQNPKSGAPYLKLGLLEVDFKHYDEAHQAFVQARTDPTTAAAAFNNLGNLAFLQKDWSLAEANYKQAEEKNPEDAGISLNLSRLYLKQGLSEKASAAFKQAIKLDPTLKDTYGDVSGLR